jgi:hypothetical protein
MANPHNTYWIGDCTECQLVKLRQISAHIWNRTSFSRSFKPMKCLFSLDTRTISTCSVRAVQHGSCRSNSARAAYSHIFRLVLYSKEVTEQVGSSREVGYSDMILAVSLVTPGGNTLNYATTSSFNILSNYLFPCHSTIRRHIV